MDERLAPEPGVVGRARRGHVDSEFYDVARFRDGGSTLRPFEREEVGDVTGKRLVHLQCHFGLDSMSWARAGASVRGLDFSGPAVEAANALAAELGIDASFVQSDVHDAVDGARRRALRHRLHGPRRAQLASRPRPRWAAIVAELLKPGGFLYLSEFHPITWIYGDNEPRSSSTTSTTRRARASTTTRGQLRRPRRPDPQQRDDRVGAPARRRRLGGARRRAAARAAARARLHALPALHAPDRGPRLPRAPASSTASPRASLGFRSCTRCAREPRRATKPPRKSGDRRILLIRPRKPVSSRIVAWRFGAGSPRPRWAVCDLGV